MLTKKWLYELPYLMLAVLIISFLCTHSPNLELDIDPSYIKFGAARPPIYPIFIWLFHWAGPYQFSMIIWIQGILLFSALLYARHWLKKNLNISDFPIFLVCLLVILTIGFHFQIWFIQSEGLAFPFFIWSFFLLIECFQKFSLKKIAQLAILVSILVLTRLQFYYFYGIFGILAIWYLWQKTPFISLIMTIFILFGSMLLTLLIDHSYHYLKHGHFAEAPYGGLMIMIQTLYLAENDAASYFQNPTEKAYVQTIIDQRNAQQLNSDANLIKTLKPSYFQYAYQEYSRNYLAMQSIIENTLKTSVEITDGKKTNFESNTVAFDINKTLISHESKKNLLFFLWKFVQCMGGVPSFLFFFIFLIALPYKIIKEKIQEPNLPTLFVGMVTLVTFLNAAIIATCNPDVAVYFCYSQFMLYCLAAFLINKTLKFKG